MPQPDIVRRRAASLIEAYRKAWVDIVKQQRRVAADPRRYARQARLVEMRRSIEAILTQLDDKAAKWFASEFPKVYGSGARSAARDIRRFDLDVPFRWTQIHQDAVRELATDTFSDLLKATRYTRRDTKRFIREAGKIYSELATTTDRTAIGAARELMNDLVENRGITSVRYRDGSRHGLREYSRMLIRTKTATAYNIGGLNLGQEYGVEWYECFDGPGCGWTFHEDTEQALGKIVTYDESVAWPISHPNCRRAFGPRPDLTTKKAAKAAQGGQVTASQIEAQLASDAARLRR